MSKILNKKWIGTVALALACVMIGAGLASFRPASAETKTVAPVQSPYTEAIKLVENSIVGVNNYQIVNYGNGYGNGYGNYYFPWGDFYNWPYGGYGNGYGNDGGSSKEIEYGSGSGVVIAEHYVLTNYHVVEKASSLKVAVANAEKEETQLLEATVAASDSDKDVAVLYVPDLTLAPVALGNSDELQVGDYVFNIGNPIGFTNTVTAGIVSGLNREVSTDTKTDRYGRRSEVVNTMIQTDAAINSGNSGGGMFNTAGELVGIPTLKYTGTRSMSSAPVESIGMCIPINEAKPVIEEALNGTVPEMPSENQESSEEGSEPETNRGLVGKPRLGVTVTTLSGRAISEGLLPRGAYVTEVESGSPAEEAGLQQGDIIVEVNGEVISNSTGLSESLQGMKEGDQVSLKLYRTGVDLFNTEEIPENCEYIDITVTLAIVDRISQ